MQASDSYLQKKYTLLIRKINVTSSWNFIALTNLSGHESSLSGYSECLLNEQLAIFSVQRHGESPKVQLHILSQINGECHQMGAITFDMNNEKLVKPLSKQFFSKQFDNRQGNIEYKVIGKQTIKVGYSDFQNATALKNNLTFKLNQDKFNKEEVETLKQYIKEKDDIIQNLNEEMAKLIDETRKLKKNLSREKQKSLGKDKIDKGFSLNVKVNPSSSLLEREVKNFEKEREDYKIKIDRLWKQIKEFELRQEKYQDEINRLKNNQNLKESTMQNRLSQIRGEYQVKFDKEKKQRQRLREQNWEKDRELSKSKIMEINLRRKMERQAKQAKKKDKTNQPVSKLDVPRAVKQIQQVFESQAEQNQNEGKHYSYSNDDYLEDEEAIRQQIIQEQMQQHIQRLEQQLLRREQEYQLKENKLKRQLQEKEDRRMMPTRFESDNQMEISYQREIAKLQAQIVLCNEKIDKKQLQLKEIKRKLQKAEASIASLEDENIQLRKQKKKSPDNIMLALKQLDEESHSINIAAMEKKQIDDQKLKTQIQDLKYKIKKMEDEHEDAIKNKDLQIMRLSLSEKSALKEKDVYSKRITEMMNKAQGAQKQYFEALEQAHKYETMESRAKQLQIENSELINNNTKLMKEKQEIQKQMKKMKIKIEEREGEWVRLKSVESQTEYYKNQCEKLEKANKNFEKQFETLKQYANSIHAMKTKKPIKTKNEQRNKEIEERYLKSLGEKVEALLEETRRIQTKYYIQQIEIWLTERTNLIHFYAKKLEDDKRRVSEIEGINKESRQKLMEEKMKEINSLRDQQIEDVDRKIEQLRKELAKVQNVSREQVETGKFNWESKINDLQKRMKKISDRQEIQDKTNEKNTAAIKKLTEEVENQKKRYKSLLEQRKPEVQSLIKDHKQHTVTENFGLKRSGTESSDWKLQEMRKSYMDLQKTNTAQYKQLREQNSALTSQKNKLDIEIKNLRHQMTKDKIQHVEKVKNLERQLRKIQDNFSVQKTYIDKKEQKERETMDTMVKKTRELETSIKNYYAELNEITEQLKMREIQVKELLAENGKLSQALDSYEAGERRMLEEMKKIKKSIQDQQLQNATIMKERNQRFIKIEKIKDAQIEQLKIKIGQCQMKNQKEVVECLSLTQKLQESEIKIQNYDKQLKTKEEQYNVLLDQHNQQISELNDEVKMLREQNQSMTEQIQYLVQDIHNKEVQCQQLLIQVNFGKQKQEQLISSKTNLQKGLELAKKKIQELQNTLHHQTEEFNLKSKDIERLRDMIEKSGSESMEIKMKLIDLEKENKNLNEMLTEREKEVDRLSYERTFMTERINRQIELREEEKERVRSLEMQIKEERNKYEEKISNLEESLLERQRSKSKQSKKEDAKPNSLQKTVSIPKPLKSIAKISSKKSYADISHQPSFDEHIPDKSDRVQKSQTSQIGEKDVRYSKEDMNLHILPPQGTKLTQNRIPHSKASSSKIDIEVAESDDEAYHHESQEERSIVHDVKQRTNGDIIQEQRSMVEESMMDSNNLNDIFNENRQLKEKMEKMILDMQELQDRVQGYEQLLQTYKKNSTVPEDVIVSSRVDFMGDRSINKRFSEEKQKSFYRKESIRDKFTERDDLSVRNYSRKQNSINQQVKVLQDQLASRELEIQQLTMKNKETQIKYEEEKNNLEKLMNEFNIFMKQVEENKCKSEMKETLMVNENRELLAQIQMTEKKLEEMVQENLIKDESLKEEMKLVEELSKDVDQKILLIQDVKQEISTLQAKLKKSTKTNSENRMQFRKYEEQAQLQILHHKQQLQEYENKNKELRMDLEIMAEKFLEQQAICNNLQSQLQEKERQIMSERANFKEAQVKYNNMNNQLIKNSNSRESLIKKIGDLEMQVNAKNQQIKDLVKETAMTMKKNQITLQTEKTEHELTKKKLREREGHITNLKMELARYNQLCHNLEKDKTNLSNEIIKLEKQLKDIMKTYQREIDELEKDKISLKSQLEKQGVSSKQSDQRASVLNKEIIKKDREIKELTYKIEESEKQMMKQKERSRKEIGDLYTQLQLKNNEFEKVRVQLERESEFYFTKECEFMAEKQTAASAEKQYKSKLQKYEEMIHHMEEQFKVIKDRPSSDQYEEILFENELYKNRIEELEAEVKEKGDREQERIYSEFRRYKMSKEKEINELQMEMEKYGNKFHDLQENNYILRKQNESMKAQLRGLMQQKLRMQKSTSEYEQDIKDLKQELAFYKNKRVEDLNKLLNETYD